ncbi:MAG: hypothetical protein ACOC0P_07460, partial [Planctomycetota bacterium]
GFAVDASEDIIVVGAPYEATENEPGRAYLFDRATGDLINTLTSVTPVALDRFGNAVAIDGSTSLVSAIEGSLNGVRSGVVEEFDALTGVSMARFTSTSAEESARFGTSLALEGTRAIIGAPGIDGFASDTGTGFIFERSGSAFAVGPDPLLGLNDGTFVLTGARPDERAWVLYSFDGISSSGTFLRRLNVVTDLNAPQIAFGPVVSDAAGRVALSAEMPAVFDPLDVWFQVVQDRFVSNWVETAIVP